MRADAALSALPALIELGALIVGIVVVRMRTTGTRRTLGTVGFAVMAAVVALRGVGQAGFPMLYASLGSSFTVVYGLLSALLALVWVGGIGLVIAALAVRDRNAAPQPYPQQPFQP